MFTKGHRLSVGNKGGRPKGTNAVKAELMRKILVDEVKKEFKPIIRGQIDLAKGIVVEKTETLSSGEKVKRYYKEKPDITAASKLVEQAIGKPKEDKTEVSVPEIRELAEAIKTLALK